MRLFFWRDNEALDQFSISLANHLYKKVSPERLRDAPDAKKIRKQLEMEIERILRKLRNYKHEHRLGVYKTARLQSTFIYRMKELGYDQGVIDLLNELMLLKTPR